MTDEDFDDWFSPESSELRDCCGVRVLHNFPEYNWGFSDLTQRNKQGIKRWIKGRLTGKEAMVIVALTDAQNRMFEEVLLQLKFTMVNKGKNYKTGNIIYLYTRTTSRSRSKQKRVFG